MPFAKTIKFGIEYKPIHKHFNRSFDLISAFFFYIQNGHLFLLETVLMIAILGLSFLQ